MTENYRTELSKFDERLEKIDNKLNDLYENSLLHRETLKIQCSELAVVYSTLLIVLWIIHKLNDKDKQCLF